MPDVEHGSPIATEPGSDRALKSSSERHVYHRDIDISPLGRPIVFEHGERVAKNRLLKAAMTERMASWHPTNLAQRGVPTADMVRLYERWGEGGYGVIITGNIFIANDQLESRGNATIPLNCPFHDERFDAYEDIAGAAKKHGSLIVAQLNHPGRQVPISINANPISASNVKLEGVHLNQIFGPPRMATAIDLWYVVQGFGYAAEYLEEVGFDGIQIHAAHGYLLSQFLSSNTNHRLDMYGGDIRARARLLTRITDFCRHRTRNGFIIGIKLNSVEFQDGGLTPAEAAELCDILESTESVDFVELSGGTYERMAFRHQRESTRRREAFFAEFAELIVPRLNRTRSYLTGGFRSAGAMAAAMAECGVDGVGIGRPTAQEPNLANGILKQEIPGALKLKIPEENFPVTVAAAGALMRMISEGREPADLTKEENVNALMLHITAHLQRMRYDVMLAGHAPMVKSYVD
ncbi:hypothetical protein BDY21DRAFT_293707 [Lineolata rhizophorae]|uniref:NADH:flavin oxidoreductase/NADH oxidase N-terminal domain-containing protein n=1 Tax=Lineolata rhizophorae TaxID=578093 RepID=A0A6A6NMS0_9PEZI|nr:hypothetical protein BDY21DRAFT_293707 [Lineolata rhizophorae]